MKTFDADIFVKFNYRKYNERSGELSDILEKNLKRIFKKVARLHGSRDYFQLKIKGFNFEIVPILDIKKAEAWFRLLDIGEDELVEALKKAGYEITDTDMDIFEDLKLED